MDRVLAVLRTGPLSVITDLGRPGLAHLGVPRSGALDPPALRLSNRLVGNNECAAGCEMLLGGLALRAEGGGCQIAVTGAPVPLAVRRGPSAGPGRAVGSHRAVYLAAGDVLEVGAPQFGARSYLAVSGGFAVAEVLGSRSTDLLSELGPPPLSAGDRLPFGAPPGPLPTGEPVVPWSAPTVPLRVPVRLGPRDDWFTEPTAMLRAGTWTVGSASNRVGLRLEGPALARTEHRRGAELLSEPMMPGAVQVPPNGQPVIFLADGPTTGGYPVIGVIPPAALPALAQLRPGSPVQLRPTPARSTRPTT